MASTPVNRGPRPRVLGMRDLIVYGIVLIQPIAPVGIFGIAQKLSGGFVVTTILFAMAAMMCTASSYGKLAARFPSAGSAYTYVGQAFGPVPGFLTGWAMFLDYLIIPILNVIYASLTLARMLPAVPYFVWVLLTAAAVTWLNLRGVNSMARANQLLLMVMTVVIVLFVVLAIRFLFRSDGWSGLISMTPFYDPATFHLRPVLTATSLAALTYIGFDGVTTLAEEVRDPRRTVPAATVLVCLLTGIFSAVEVYLAQRVWPDFSSYPNLETAFLDVTSRVGGAWLFQAMGIVLVVACFGSGLTGQAGAARLLYAMGRDGALPRRIFGRWDDARQQPSGNILVIGGLTAGGALLVSYEITAELLNFGAFVAFCGVNLAAIRTFCIDTHGQPRSWITGGAVPALGFAACAAIWWGLPAPAKIAGGAWFLLGLLRVMLARGAWTSTMFADSPIEPG